MTEKTDIRDSDEKVVEIEMERLRTFTNHPFKVIGDSQMIELQDSIKKYGLYKEAKKSYSVVYRVNDADGTEHQKSEGYTTLKEAEKRKKEIEYKQSLGTFVVPKCTRVKELIKEYVRIYGHNEWGVATYDGNVGLINNYIIPTIGEVQLSEINNHFMEKYYTDLLKMPAVKSSRNPDGDKLITAATVHQIHKVLRSCFRQAVKWDMMDKNPATDATLPKYKAEEREIWTAEMLMQAIDACENKWLKVHFIWHSQQRSE